MTNNDNNNRKDVFVIRDGKNGDSFWTKVGAAFVNRDGSLNVLLDALPTDGKLHIRDAKAKQPEVAEPVTTPVAE